MTILNKFEKNIWAYLATLMLFAGAISHFCLIDMALLKWQAEFIKWHPEPLIDQLHTTEIDLSIFGGNNAYYIFSGFSFCLALSLLFFGFYNWIVLNTIEPGHKPRQAVFKLSFVFSVSFSLVAATCFIYTAASGAFLATLFFAFAASKEIKLGKIKDPGHQA